MGLRDRIKEFDDIKKEIVHVDSWGEDVEVRGLMGCDRASLMNECLGEDGKLDNTKFYPGIVVSSCYDPETGEKLFQPGDEDWIMRKSAGAIDMLAAKGMKLSGLTKEAVKDAEGNS